MRRPMTGLACGCAAPRGRMEYVALLLEDGVALCRPPPDLSTVCIVQCEARPEVMACSGALLAVATRRELRFYAVLTEADGVTTLAARLRGRARPLHFQPKGIDVASLVPGAAPGAAHGVSAIVGAAGLVLAGTASDAGVEASATHHRGCSIGACKFSDDGSLLALAAIDGRILVRQRPAAGGNAAWAAGLSTLLWCARCPCERVLSFDFSACGRWLALAGWRSDAAVYDCATFPSGAPSSPVQPAARTLAAATNGNKKDTPQQPVSVPWEDWRMVWLAGASDAAAPAPALTAWCRAPSRDTLLCCSRPVRSSGGGGGPEALNGQEPRPRLWIGSVGVGDDLVSQTPSLLCAPGASPLRGLCTGRVSGGTAVGGDGTAAAAATDSEVLVWIDAEGNVGTEWLWAWDGGGGDGEALKPRELTRSSYGSASLLLPPAAAQGAPTAQLLITPSITSAAPVNISLPAIAAEALMREARTRDTCALVASAKTHHWERAHVALGPEHVLVLAGGADAAVQWTRLAEGDAWRTHVLEGACEAACILGAHALLLTTMSQSRGAEEVDVTDGAANGCTAQPGAPVLHAIDLNAPPRTSNITASQLAPPIVAPDSNDHQRPWMSARLLACTKEPSLDATSTPTDAGSQLFVLLVERTTGGRVEGWLGSLSSGSPPQILSPRPLRVLSESGDDHDAMCACRLLDGGSAVELIKTPATSG